MEFAKILSIKKSDKILDFVAFYILKAFNNPVQTFF